MMIELFPPFLGGGGGGGAEFDAKYVNRPQYEAPGSKIQYLCVYFPSSPAEVYC